MHDRVVTGPVIEGYDDLGFGPAIPVARQPRAGRHVVAMVGGVATLSTIGWPSLERALWSVDLLRLHGVEVLCIVNVKPKVRRLPYDERGWVPQ